MSLYDCLGISNTADMSEIKAAYRKQTLKWHPDKNLNNREEAGKLFLKINHAYSILSDTQKRNMYDKFGEEALDDNFENPLDVFKHFFDSEDDIPNIFVSIPLILEELYSGTKKDVQLSRYSPCKRCSKPSVFAQKEVCHDCGGTGTFIDIKTKSIVKCILCEGAGIDPTIKKCKKCDGIKFFKENIIITVDIPQGSYDGFYIIIENEGHYIPIDDQEKYGKKRSDIFFIVDEKPHDIFQRGVYLKKTNINIISKIRYFQSFLQYNIN